MKKLILFFLVLLLIVPSFGFGSNLGERIFQLGIMGQGGLHLDQNMTRAQLSTVAIRLMGLEHLLDVYHGKSSFNDVDGWALPYVNMASKMGVMKGRSKDTFDPNGLVTYGQVLTVVMRILGYEDGIDFTHYPEDYSSKALKIGLANLYIPFDQVVNRGTVAETLDRALDLNIKDSPLSLYDFLYGFGFSPNGPNVAPNIMDQAIIYMGKISFSTGIFGQFSGSLIGLDDFTGFKVVLLSKDGRILKNTFVNGNGSFSMEGFDVGIVNRIQGYKYEVYTPDGYMVLGSDLI